MCGLTYIMAHTRLAPIQVSTWGHSETSGISTIDYYVSSDLYETEDAQQYYSEKLIRMKSLSTYYYSLDILQDAKSATGDTIHVKILNHLYKTHHTYGVFQTMFKYHPDTIWVIRELLQRDPNCVVLILLDKNTATIENMETQLGPLCSRLRMIDKMNKQEYCRMIRCVDILIDSYPFGGCNTSMDGFYFQTIVMTCPSNKLNGRFTYGFYKRMDIMEPVCENLEDLVNRSIYYASNETMKTELEKRIYEKSNILYEELSSAIEWNQLFRKWGNSTRSFFTPHLVISCFKEDLNYLNDYPFKMTLYNKGPNKVSNSIALPNIGKCDHTYLTFIIDHYSDLPELTLFLPASFYYKSQKKHLRIN